MRCYTNSGAQKASADAVALAPDLPAAYCSWGLALERHGDHRHFRGKQKRYKFATVEQLIADFLEDVRQLRGES